MRNTGLLINYSCMIDESMISFTGRSFGLVYMPRKPIQNGFKIYVLADAEGYVLRFQPSFLYKKTTKVSVVVFDLMNDLYLKSYHLFIDRYSFDFSEIFIFRYFTTINLMNDLQTKGVCATCAITKGRLPLGKETKKEIEKAKSGDIRFWKAEQEANKLLIAFWKDKKELFFVSNYYNNEKTSIQRRGSRDMMKMINQIKKNHLNILKMNQIH